MNGFGRDDQKEKKERSRATVMTRETLGMTLLLFSAIIFFICVTGPWLFGEIGVAIAAFFIGIFGYLVYPLLVYMIYQSVVLVFGKGRVSWAWKLRVGFLILAAFLIVHEATAERFYGEGYGEYLASCWGAAREGAAFGTGGGVVLGAIVYPVRAVLSPAGAYIVFTVLVLLAIFFIIWATPLRNKIKNVRVGKRKDNKGGYDPNETFDDDDEKPAMGFEDLTPPMHRMPLTQGQPVSRAPGASVAASMQAAQTQSLRNSDKDKSKEILFGANPQDAYRNNLIFSDDSYFNSRERSSSLYGNLTRPGAPQNSMGAESYSTRYFTEAQRPAEEMPRRISEEKSAPDSGYTYSPANDISYTQTPSYRAEPQKTEPSEKRNYYENDVPYNAEFSSEPDLPAEDEGRTGFIPEPEFKSTPAAEPPANDLFGRMLREQQAEKPERKQPEPEDTKIDYSSSASIRSLFSHPVGEDRTRLPREPVTPEEERPSRSERAFLNTERDIPREGRRLSRGSDGEEESSREQRRGFGRDGEESPREQRRGFGRDSEESPRDEFGGFSRREEPAPGDFTRSDRSSAASLFDDDSSDSGDFRRDDTPAVQATPRTRAFAPREREERIAPPSSEAAPAPQPKRHIYRQYVAPDYSLFKNYNDAVMVSQEEIERNSAAIEEQLAAFKIDAKVVKVTCGATVTRYDLEIPGNVSVSTVIKRDEEIAMRLHAPDGVNVYANRANGTVSVDVPNTTTATVGLRPLLYAPEYVNSKPGSLMFVIGKDVEGKPVIGNIVKMKQLLVAGTTGSGKSVTLHSMLISLICKYSPEDLRLILIDPKGEFTIYEGLPHLMINEIISDAQKAITALNWAIKEMERRYALFQQKTRAGTLARNIDEYNMSLTEDEEKLCKIVIVVDELADLMSVAKKDIEERIQRLTQKSRAAGIHLVISTQRPSVDVITGVIKGNLPTRMALRVIQEVDSRTIIDETGAQKLLGNGDMLFRTEGMFNCMRVQGAFLSSKEVEQIIANVKANNEAYFDTEVADYINNPGQATGAAMDGDDGGSEEVNDQYIKALGIVVKLGTASISLIQRKCSVGYNHAGKIIEWMEIMGYISPFDGKAKARTVLLTKEEFESKYGSLD